MIQADTAEHAIITAKIQLSRILNRVKKLGLSVNANKTNIIIFNKKVQKNISANINTNYLGEIEIPIIDHIKYLGIYIYHRWKFDTHIEYLEEKAQKIIKAVSRVMLNLCGPCDKEDVFMPTR